MSPKAKEFYNKLLSFYLDDNSVYNRLENSYREFLKLKKRNNAAFTGLSLEGYQKDLELYFTQLSDAEISEVIKTFKMRMFPTPESQVMINGNTITFNPIMSSTAIRGFKLKKFNCNI